MERADNILWNAELRRALIIDFHWAKLDRQPKRKEMPSCGQRRRSQNNFIPFANEDCILLGCLEGTM